ncbi:MAG: SCO family protein [Solirubrobacterales bacterium]|nr:SCO family protein [Solirubrobacterales bacterium]
MRAKLAASLIALLVVAALIGLLAFKGSSDRTPLPGGAREAAAGSGLYGTLTLPARQAPAIALRNDRGERVTLAQYRGRAVLVTFLYAHCPDVCPLIAANLRVALKLLGPRAAKAQLIAVSVDPRGDTARSVRHFLGAHELLGRMQYLIGSGGELSRTWKAWSVGSTRDVGQPELVAHSALVYGISASGRLTDVYPSSFEPSEIVHDVPRLAAR